MITMTKEDIEKEKDIPVYYGDDELRNYNKAISLNKYILSNVEQIKIENSLILFLDGNKEILRTRVEDVVDIIIDEKIGAYVINKN